MQNTSLLPSLPGPHCSGMEVPDRVLSLGKIELNCVNMLNICNMYCPLSFYLGFLEPMLCTLGSCYDGG